MPPSDLFKRAATSLLKKKKKLNFFSAASVSVGHGNMRLEGPVPVSGEVLQTNKEALSVMSFSNAPAGQV